MRLRGFVLFEPWGLYIILHEKGAKFRPVSLQVPELDSVEESGGGAGEDSPGAGIPSRRSERYAIAACNCEPPGTILRLHPCS